MLKKQFYEAPEAEMLVVKFEENFCGTLNGTGDGNEVTPFGAPSRTNSYRDPFDYHGENY